MCMKDGTKDGISYYGVLLVEGCDCKNNHFTAKQLLDCFVSKQFPLSPRISNNFLIISFSLA